MVGGWTSGAIDKRYTGWHRRGMAAEEEIANAIRTRRIEIGLSQLALAELSGVPIDAVTHLEQGVMTNLKGPDVAAVLAVIGLGPIDSGAIRPWRSTKSTISPPLNQAARMASVSYRGWLDSSALWSALLCGSFPRELTAYMAALLEEVPVSLLARVVEQLHGETGTARPILWSNMRCMALNMKTTRELWLKVA